MTTTFGKRAAALLAATASVAAFGLGIAGAAPAQAADTLVGCDGTNLVSNDATITYPGDCDPNKITTGDDNAEYMHTVEASCYIVFTDGGADRVYGDAACGWALYFVQDACEYVQYVFGTEYSGLTPSASNSCSGGSSGARAASVIPPWVQAYGRSAGEGCIEGWAPSWEQWAVNVTGGWVCTRTVPSLG